MEKLMIDSDVLINWLAQEKEKGSHRKLWMAPAAILELGEMQQIENHISLLSVFEIRFVLRRKKGATVEGIERDLRRLEEIMRIDCPSEDTLRQADQLQSEHLLNPFDSIILAQAISCEARLVSRDRRFLQIAEHYVPGYSPEDYLDDCLN